MNYEPLPEPPPLPEAVLERRKNLPAKMTPVTLEGRYVRLVPLDLEAHTDILYAISNGMPISIGGRSIGAYDSEAIIWRWMNGGPFTNTDGMREYLRGSVDAPNGLAMCTIDLELDYPVGVATYMNNYPEQLKVVLGSIWYSPIAQRTRANLEATYLMLKHAFDLGYRRLEWKCNALNERSRRAALKMGFTFEGIQEAHFIVKGRNRDTAWFRILDSEWDRVKAQLETMLEY
jgi:RimJ/RimL family protein N-acetyltransferase